jgi:hypothetical protein
MPPSHRATDGRRARGETCTGTRGASVGNGSNAEANCAGPWSVFCASRLSAVSYYTNLHPSAECSGRSGAAVTLGFGSSSLVFLASIPGKGFTGFIMEVVGRRWTITYCLAGSLPRPAGDGDGASRWGRRDCRGIAGR